MLLSNKFKPGDNLFLDSKSNVITLDLSKEAECNSYLTSEYY